MKKIECETWDDKRVIVNIEFAELFRAHNLTTFSSLMNFDGGTIAKNLLRERTTTRFTLRDSSGFEQAFYIKRHGPPPWKEYIKPLLRLTRPLLGARHEWEAILQFLELGLPTMIPVALGESNSQSWIVTRAIEDCTKLSHWAEAQAAEKRDRGNQEKPNGSGPPNGTPRYDRAMTREVIHSLATIARRMHQAGLHHQDFYLTHFLHPNSGPCGKVYVIDLGRVQRHQHLSERWIIKDLAQLNYSASLATTSDRTRFLKTYLGRALNRSDRRLLRKIERKSRAIARHSAKNRL